MVGSSHTKLVLSCSHKKMALSYSHMYLVIGHNHMCLIIEINHYLSHLAYLSVDVYNHFHCSLGTYLRILVLNQSTLFVPRDMSS